jgi:hypothetical protein
MVAAVMTDDYQKDLDRFMNAWEQVQRDMQAQERLQQLADKNGLSVEEVQATLERINHGFRQLGIARRPTRSEIVDMAMDGEPDE